MISAGQKISVAILAGGKSSRMNKEKGLIQIDGIPMINRIADSLKTVASEVIVIANDEGYSQCGYPVFADLIKEMGPVSGIHSALQHAKHETVVIVSCDVPFVSKDFIEFLLSQQQGEEIIVPVHQGKVEPLIAVYKKSKRIQLQQCMEAGQTKLQDILIALKAVQVKVPENLFSEQVFVNINTPEDLMKAFPQILSS